MQQLLLLILFLSYCLLANAQSFEKINLSETLAQYLPDYHIQQQIRLNGEIIDIDFAKTTGEIIVVLDIESSVVLQFLNPNGTIKWQKEFNKTLTSHCHISNNANSVVFSQSYGNENYLIENYVFDNKGTLLFEKKANEAYLRPSPDGNYFFFYYTLIERDKTESIEIFDLTGKVVSNFLQDKQLYLNAVKFLDNSLVLVYYKTEGNSVGKLALSRIENNQLNKLWDKEFPTITALHGRSLFEDNIDYKHPYISICTERLMVLDIDGNEIYSVDSPFLLQSFIDDQNLFVYQSNQKTASIFNLQNKKVTSFPLYIPNLRTQRSLQQIDNLYLFEYFGSVPILVSDSILLQLTDYEISISQKNDEIRLFKREVPANITILGRNQ